MNNDCKSIYESYEIHVGKNISINAWDADDVKYVLKQMKNVLDQIEQDNKDLDVVFDFWELQPGRFQFADEQPSASWWVEIKVHFYKAYPKPQNKHTAPHMIDVEALAYFTRINPKPDVVNQREEWKGSSSIKKFDQNIRLLYDMIRKRVRRQDAKSF